MSSRSVRWAACAVLAALAVFVIGDVLHPSVAWAAGEAAHTTKSFGNSKAAAFMFWLFAAGSIGGSLFVITRRNMVAAVMGMVGTFFAIAGLYLMLYASFLAVIQVLVYAGAIMVLFVFVIMILNRPDSNPWAIQGILGKGSVALGLGYLFVRMAKVLWAVKDSESIIAKPVPMLKAVIEHGEQVQRVYDFGSVKGVGYTLFSSYLFPFEAVSFVLLVAVVGAVAITRSAQLEAVAGNRAAAEAAGEAQ